MGSRAVTAALAALAVVAVGCGSSNGASSGSSSVQVAAAETSSGSAARELLSATPYTTLHVEVGFVAGLEPSSLALERLGERLGDLVNKPGGVNVTLGSPIAAPSQSVWSVADCLALERANRKSAPFAAPVASIYVLYMPGESSRDAQGSTTLGWSVSPTSFAVFAQTIAMNPPAVGSAADLEGAVLVHEACHLLGLVNNGTPELCEHEDPTFAAHCTTPGCLMAARSFTWDLSQGGTLCPACRADLRANGGR